MMTKIARQLKIWFAGLLLIATTSVFAQNSQPVYVTVQVLPPYGLNLSDYYSGTRDRLAVTLFNRDQGHNTHMVKLRVTVKNGGAFSMTSRDESAYPVIELPYGVPIRLTGADIAQYLAPDRVAMNGALQNGKLPVGMTEFGVQVLDYATGRALSDVGVGRAWLELKKPPILDLPAEDEQVSFREPQHIRFQWMPRHQGLASTMYEFTLKELPANGAAPQSAFLYGNPIYQTRVRFTTLNYTHIEPLLTPGRMYGWQVRAIAVDGIDEIGMFENNGYSEVSWFYLNEDCSPPLNVTATAGYRKMTLEWGRLPEHTMFVVEYRPVSAHELYEWISAETFEDIFTATRLTPGWKYEYRVGAVVGTQKPVFSPIGEITLPLNDEERMANCGVAPVTDLANQTPQENLRPGDVVTIGGDFPMTLTEVSSQGNGWYSGKGWINLPWVFDVEVAVTFNRLRVNTDNVQIDGEVETSYDPEASQIADLNELDYGGERTTEAKGVEFATGDPVQVDFVVPPMPQAEYDTDKGELTITGEDGEPHIVTVPPRNEGESVFPMEIVDAEGNKYLLDVPPGTEQAGPEEDAPADGTDGETTADRSGGGTVPVTVTPIEDIAGGIDTTQLNEGAGVVVRFSKGDGKFAFDAAEQDWYRTALLVRDKYYNEFGKGYIAPWKLVPVGESDTVEAVIAEGKAKPEDIGFVLKDGTGVPAKESGGKWTLTLPSVGNGEEYAVFAVLKKRNGNLTVGKLNVVSYPKQTRTVTLVPVFERFPDVGAVERELNAIYAPYGVEFTVAEDNSMIGVWDWDLDGDGALNLDGSGFFSNETDEMKALRKAYQSAGNYDRNGYYLFVMREAKADTEPEFTAAGDMPRGKQFGYLFSADPGPSLSRLAAHELGHGIFTLTHTFDSNYGGGDSRAQTPNLMDYAGGTDLGAFQWSVIAKPAPLTWFDNEEDGMAWYIDLSTGLIKYFEGSANLLQSGYLFLAEGDKSISIGEIEDSLIAKGYEFMSDPNIPGKFWVDTRTNLKGWYMMQIFHPENLSIIFGLSTFDAYLTREIARKAAPVATELLNGTASKRVFWSGGQNPAVKIAAEKFAVENGMTTLEMTTGGQILSKIPNGVPWQIQSPLWKLLSARYASGAKEAVHVFHNAGGIGTSSIWGTVEYPILRASGVEIIYHVVP